MGRPALALLACTSLFAPLASAGQVLLRDDFDGSALDTTKWFVPTGDGTFFGRTQIRPPSAPLTVGGGVIRLQLDTWNPSALVPGDSFFGSEIDWVSLGRGLGVAGVRVESADAFAEALSRSFAEPGPSLIEAVIT